MDKKNYLFEISWEVCNKIGGINTVIVSKIPFIMKKINNYFLMGPFREKNDEFTYVKVPKKFENVFNELESMGIKVHYGKYEISSKPGVMLIEYLGYSSKINEIKGKNWELYGVDSLGTNWHDYDEVILWSWCSGIVIDKLNSVIKNDKINVHCHEWMSAGAIFYLKSLQNKNKYWSVFTAHATMLGRALSGGGKYIYNIGKDFDPQIEAYKSNVAAKHLTEKAVSNIADVFTTVSEITALEAERFFSKKADKLLYNGFDFEDKHLFKKRDISRNLLENYVKQYYPDLDFFNTYYFFTSGRNEFRNKGVDLYIKSLGILNEKLKNTNKTIINFFLVPIGNYDVDKNPFDKMPLSTHVDVNCEIIDAFKKENLLNEKPDNVKVVLIPVYLDGNDGLFNIDYYEFIAGFDLGVFPSFYEPWGYTPVECINLGINTLTSDLAGFGRAVLKDFNKNSKGVFVLGRENKNFDQSVLKLTSYMFDFIKQDKKKIEREREKIIKFSKNFSWEKFVKNYIKVYK